MGENSTNRNEPDGGWLRRTVLKAGAIAVGSVSVVGTAAADSHVDDGNDENGEEGGDTQEAVDEPDGFEVEVLAPHAAFPDDVSATFGLEFADGEGDSIDVELDDASTLVVAEVAWTPGGSSGWHRHPGPVLVNVAEGELELTWERDCTPRTYAAGESFLDSGEVHTATNASDDECARAYALFLGIHDGEPATEWVPPVEC